MCEAGEGRGDEVRERSPLHELGDRDQLGFFDAEINDRDKFRTRVRRTGASTVAKGPLVRFVYFLSDKASCWLYERGSLMPLNIPIHEDSSSTLCTGISLKSKHTETKFPHSSKIRRELLQLSAPKMPFRVAHCRNV